MVTSRYAVVQHWHDSSILIVTPKYVCTSSVDYDVADIVQRETVVFVLHLLHQ